MGNTPDTPDPPSKPPGKAEVLAWMAETGRGHKAASKVFGISLAVVRDWARSGHRARDRAQATAAPTALTTEGRLIWQMQALEVDLELLRQTGKGAAGLATLHTSYRQLGAALDIERERLASLAAPSTGVAPERQAADLCALISRMPAWVQEDIAETLSASLPEWGRIR